MNIKKINYGDINSLLKISNDLKFIYNYNIIKKYIDNKNNDCYKLLLHDKIIGFFIIKNKNHISFISIYKKYRNQGYGSKIMQIIKDKYPNKNITLFVSTKNHPALKLYRKHNFKIYKLIKNYYNNSQDAYYMVFHNNIEHFENIKHYKRSHCFTIILIFCILLKLIF